MRRGWLVLLLVSLGLNIGLALAITSLRTGHRPLAFLGAGELPPPPPPEAEMDSLVQQRLHRITARLDLSPEQDARFRAARQAALPEILARRSEVRRLRTALHDAYGAQQVERNQVQALVARLALAQGRLDSTVAAAFLDELAVLTPAQREIYLGLMPWGHGPGHGRGRGRGCPPR